MCNKFILQGRDETTTVTLELNESGELLIYTNTGESHVISNERVLNTTEVITVNMGGLKLTSYVLRRVYAFLEKAKVF